MSAADVRFDTVNLVRGDKHYLCARWQALFVSENVKVS